MECLVFLEAIYVSWNSKMDPSVKSLTITGSAVEDASRSRLKAGSRRKRILKGEEDDFIEQAKNFVLQGPKVEPKLEPKLEPKVVEPKLEPKVEPKVEQSVILKPPKQARVKLQPKISVPVSVDHVTRKARRIKLHVGNLTHRVTRAKRVRSDTEKKSMDTIREYLIQRGVIQAKSKAPEKMLRSMYSDFMLLKDQAL